MLDPSAMAGFWINRSTASTLWQPLGVGYGKGSNNASKIDQLIQIFAFAFVSCSRQQPKPPCPSPCRAAEAEAGWHTPTNRGGQTSVDQDAC